MNVVFLTSRTAHHYYLINELNKHHPVKMVFFEVQHVQRRTWGDRFKRWKKIKNIQASFADILNRVLFGREDVLEERYEREKLFNNIEPSLEASIPSKDVFSFNDPKAVEEVKKQDPDLIIVFGTEILKGRILHVAKSAILNIHRGILPKYRGGSVSTWAFYNRDFNDLGVTIHVCTDALDGGDIVGQKFYSLQKDDGMHTLRTKTTIIALNILKDILERYKNGTIEYKKQEPAKLWTSRDLTITKKIIARRNLKKYIHANYA